MGSSVVPSDLADSVNFCKISNCLNRVFDDVLGKTTVIALVYFNFHMGFNRCHVWCFAVTVINCPSKIVFHFAV